MTLKHHQSAETISAVQAILFPVHARADLAVVVEQCQNINQGRRTTPYDGFEMDKHLLYV